MGKKGGPGISFFLFLAIIGILAASMLVSPQNNLPIPKILKQTIITQPVQSKKTIQEVPFKVLTTYAPTPTPTGTGLTGAACDTPAPPDIPSIQQVLKTSGLIITGDDLKLPAAIEAYNAWCQLEKSSKYLQLLGAQTNPIEIRFLYPSESQGAWAFNCTGFSDASNPQARFVELYGIEIGPTCIPVRFHFLMTHELGHQIAFRNPNIYNNWYTYAYDPSFPTWNCQLDYGPGPWPAECFADMIGEYVYYKQYEMFTDPPQPFPQMRTTYNNMYNFTRDNIFGGVEY